MLLLNGPVGVVRVHSCGWAFVWTAHGLQGCQKAALTAGEHCCSFWSLGATFAVSFGPFEAKGKGPLQATFRPLEAEGKGFH
eukprot:356456-Chlamydomonas_euryale.AAC.8